MPVFAFEHMDSIILTADEIKKMNVQKISDVLNQVPRVKAGDISVLPPGMSIWFPCLPLMPYLLKHCR